MHTHTRRPHLETSTLWRSSFDPVRQTILISSAAGDDTTQLAAAAPLGGRSAAHAWDPHPSCSEVCMAFMYDDFMYPSCSEVWHS